MLRREIPKWRLLRCLSYQKNQSGQRRLGDDPCGKSHFYDNVACVLCIVVAWQNGRLGILVIEVSKAGPTSKL